MLLGKSNKGHQLILCGIALVSLSACSSVPSKMNSGKECFNGDGSAAAQSNTVGKKIDSTESDVCKDPTRTPKIIAEKDLVYPAYAERNQIEFKRIIANVDWNIGLAF